MAAKINEVKQQLNTYLHDNSKPWTFLIEKAEKQTGVDRLYIFVGAFAAIALWLVFGCAAQLVCNLVGFVYPAYVSLHALETKSKDDDTKWLTYWVVFSIFSVVEFFADIIVGWFPLYWLIKFVFLIWLMIPSELNGSLILYNKLIRPYFLKHKSAIDEAFSKAAESAGDSAQKLLEKSD